jgi:glutamate-1-semialdehyde 2,1-aminomutase
MDDNEYIDFINGLASVTLGYNDPDVNHAVKKQLENGVTFSLPHALETEVAEKIVEMVPCAEMVRFGKNGSDATTGAIRLARAFTGRNHIAACGYHGWQDWYIGSTSRNMGVPKATIELTHTFAYNDLASLETLFDQYPDQIAAVIMEPMNTTFPETGFLEAVKDTAHNNGTLLVFDEMLTGFRYAKGGAQEYFGVVPDLATFGKGMANGYPLSAIVGRKEIMQLMEEVFFSFTFGGETLSLAAAKAVLEKIQQKPVLETIRRQGEKVMEGVGQLITRHGVGHIFGLVGQAPLSYLVIKDTIHCTQWEIKTLFFQEMFERGILTFGSHNMSYAHTAKDIEQLLLVYDEVFKLIRHAVDDGVLYEMLRAEPLVPLFKVR